MQGISRLTVKPWKRIARQCVSCNNAAFFVTDDPRGLSRVVKTSACRKNSFNGVTSGSKVYGSLQQYLKRSYNEGKRQTCTETVKTAGLLASLSNFTQGIFFPTIRRKPLLTSFTSAWPRKRHKYPLLGPHFFPSSYALFFILSCLKDDARVVRTRPLLLGLSWV